MEVILSFFSLCSAIPKSFAERVAVIEHMKQLAYSLCVRVCVSFDVLFHGYLGASIENRSERPNRNVLLYREYRELVCNHLRELTVWRVINVYDHCGNWHNILGTGRQTTVHSFFFTVRLLSFGRGGLIIVTSIKTIVKTRKSAATFICGTSLLFVTRSEIIHLSCET